MEWLQAYYFFVTIIISIINGIRATIIIVFVTIGLVTIALCNHYF